MATIFVISLDANLYPIAHRLHQEGHDVSYHTSKRGVATIPWPETTGPRLLTNGSEEAADLYILDPRGSGGFGPSLESERKLSLGGGRLALKSANNLEFRNRLGASLFPHEDGDLPPIEGIPFALSGFFNGTNWLAPFGLLLSQSRLMEGNRGLDIGTSGALLSLAPNRFQIGEGLGEFLAKAGYRGHLLVTGIVANSEVWWEGIELSSDVPLVMMWMELYKDSLYDLLLGLSSGSLKHLPLRKDGYVLGLKVSLPLSTEEEVPIPPLTQSDERHIWPDGGLEGGVVGCAWVTARGVDPTEARRRVYRTIERANPHPSVQFRRDIGNSLERDYEVLRGWGWVG